VAPISVKDKKRQDCQQENDKDKVLSDNANDDEGANQ
jgi:hypothetical protein